MKWVCESEPNLDVRQGLSSKILHKDGLAAGVETTMEVQYIGKTIVITTGTFLRGLMHIGSNQQSGGRAGDSAAMGLSSSLKGIGLELGRLKTGTPPRLLRRSIDFSKTEIQPGDNPVPYFTFWKDDLFHMEHSHTKPIAQEQLNGEYPPGSILGRLNGQLPCFITFTTERTANVIRQNLHKSPLYSGNIEGVGPDIARQSKTKSSNFLKRSAIKFSWSQRESKPMSFM